MNPLAKNQASVSGDEIKRAIDSLKESRKLENIDDSLAKSLGYPSLAQLEKVLEKQIFIQKENAQRQKIDFNKAGIINTVFIPLADITAVNGSPYYRHDIG